MSSDHSDQINLVVQCKSQSVGQWFIVSDLVIHSYLISCVFVFLHLCIWQSKISFLMSLDPWLFENIAHVGYFRHFITVYLCICVFVFVYLCIWQSRISFLMSWYRWLFKNISMLGISGTFSHAVFVYLRICICVFVYLTVQNIIFDVLGPLAFQKYSIIRVYEVFLAWWRPNEQPTGWT